MKKTIVVLDDDDRRHVIFERIFKDRFSIVHCYSADQFIEVINKRGMPDFTFLDHDLSEESILCNPKYANELTGSDVAVWLATKLLDEPDIFESKIIVHSMNPIGAENMMNILKDAGYINVIKRPFFQISDYGKGL